MSGARRGRLRIAVFAAVLSAGGAAWAHSPRSDAASIPAASVPRVLFAVAARSPANAWAVGTLIEHWNGRKWSIEPSPRTPGCTPYLFGVTAISPSDAWAAGKCINLNHLSSTALIEHWDGRRWVVRFNRRAGAGSYSELLGITATSASNMWAVGDYETSTRTQSLVEHWNGRRWSIERSPNPSTNPVILNAVSAVSRTDAWAVGYYETAVPPVTSLTLVEHWNGRKWVVQRSFSPGNAGNQFDSVVGLSASDAWAVGGYGYTSGSASGASTLAEHWDGHSWSVQSTADPGTTNGFFGVAASSPSNVWAVGNSVSGTTISTLTEHWKGSTWALTPSPSPGSGQDPKALEAVTVISRSDAWTVGFFGDGHTIIEHWGGGAWRLRQSP